MNFKIFGNWNQSDQVLLEEFELLSEAIRWTDKWCAQDLGGFDAVHVVCLDHMHQPVVVYSPIASYI